MTEQSTVVSNAKSTWPRPKPKIVRDDEHSATAFKLFEYWHSLAPEQAALAQLRVYRMWPVIDNKLAGKTTKDEDFISGPIPWNDWKEWRDEFLFRYGSGNYHVYLNETGVPNSIMEAYFSLKDWEHYPPKVDPRSLIRGDKANEDYIRWAARRGLLPADWDEVKAANGEDEDEDDMKIAEVATEVLKENSNLRREMMESVKQNAEIEIERAKAHSQSPEAMVMARTLDSAFNATNEITKMVTRNAGSQFDPVAMIEKIAVVMAPKNGNEMLELMKATIEANKSSYEQALTQQAKQFEFMQTVLQERAQNAAAVPPPVQPKSFGDTVEEIVKIKTALDSLGGKRAAAAAEPAARGIGDAIGQFFTDNPQMATGLVTTGLTLISGIVYNLTKPKDSVPVSPQEALQRGQAPPPPLPVIQQQGQGQPAQPQAPPAQPPTGPAALLPILQRIEGPFLAHFFGESKGLSGFTFAEFILEQGWGAGETPVGRQEYTAIRDAVGGPRMDEAIRWYTPMWEKIAPLEERYIKFMKEFWSFDAMVAAEQEQQQQAVPVGPKLKKVQ